MRRYLESAMGVPVPTPSGQQAMPPIHYHGNQTLNAVSFGFIATAVLFAMFLVMAIFERILRPHRLARASARDEEPAESIPETSVDAEKPEIYAVSFVTHITHDSSKILLKFSMARDVYLPRSF